MNTMTCSDQEVRRFREWRAGARVNLFDLARATGIPESRLSLLLNGRRRMTKEEGERIRKALETLEGAAAVR